MNSSHRRQSNMFSRLLNSQPLSTLTTSSNNHSNTKPYISQLIQLCTLLDLPSTPLLLHNTVEPSTPRFMEVMLEEPLIHRVDLTWSHRVMLVPHMEPTPMLVISSRSREVRLNKVTHNHSMDLVMLMNRNHSNSSRVDQMMDMYHTSLLIQDNECS